MLLLPLILGALASSSQGQQTGCTTDHSQKLGQTIPGSVNDRDFLIHIPNSYKSGVATGVVFSFHGKNRTMYDQEKTSQFSNEDKDWNPNMLAVYPQGLHNRWEGAPYSPPETHHDKQFITDLLGLLRSTYCIDNSRIFASGMSNGGGFVDVLACSAGHGGDFAAFAPVSGAFYDDVDSTSECYHTTTPRPFLEFHGANTSHIPYNGGPSSPTSHNMVPAIPDLLNRWAVRNGCPNPPHNVTTSQNNGDVHVSTYTCKGKALVQGYKIDSMGHSWPSVKAGTAPIDATPLIMAFFNANPKNTKSTGAASSRGRHMTEQEAVLAEDESQFATDREL